MIRKLDTEHVSAIQQLRSQFAANANNIGSIVIEEHLLAQTKQRLFEQLEQLKEQELSLLNQLKERYGEGQINIENGTFTPAE